MIHPGRSDSIISRRKAVLCGMKGGIALGTALNFFLLQVKITSGSGKK